MDNVITLYHGSDHVIETPLYGGGKRNNDYGQGFYCTADLELAKEWSVYAIDREGFVNAYEFESTGLRILNLDRESILTWIAVLLNNRQFEMKGNLARAAFSYLSENFLVDYESYDVITGWRADDSYFAFAGDFIKGTISVQQLERAVTLGNLGVQYVMKSRESFRRLTFTEAIPVSSAYFEKRMRRDQEARNSYLYGEREMFDKNELFITDIMRQELKRDDARLQ